MPLPRPVKEESRKDFTSRCMSSEVMNSEFPDNSQRFAVCNDIWDKRVSARLSESFEKD